MRRILYTLAVILLATSSVNANDIEHKISSTFNSSLESKDNSELESLIDSLGRLQSSNQVLYWQAYACYHNAVYYLSQKERDRAQGIIEKAIASMKSLPNKNSEDYVILARLLGLNLGFLGFPKIISAAGEVEENVDNAFKLDAENPRVYYLYANGSFHKPAMFRKKGETVKYLSKALSFPVNKNRDLPSWGREESYQLLVDHYIREGDPKQADDTLKKGLSEFPDSYMLKKKKSKL